MAELIRKDKLIDWTYRVPKYYDSMNDRTDMRDFINGLSTTTEAEIREKAIDEFAELLLSKLDVDGRDWYCARKINEVAEELKEE